MSGKLRESWIIKAKAVPIISLYKGSLKHSGRAQIGVCPFHDDKAPSLALYEDTNSFFCFAQGTGGDVITYYMLLHKLDFKEAVTELKDL